MAVKVNDARIGVMDEVGRIAQQPTRYGTGALYNRVGDPTPTTVYFGEGGKFFYVLPIGVAKVKEEPRAEMEKAVNDALAAAKEAAAKVSAATVTTVTTGTPIAPTVQPVSSNTVSVDTAPIKAANNKKSE